MADFPAPVATQIKPQDPMQGINTMSGILGLQQQRQALQTGQYQQQSAQANAQMTQQDAANRQASGAFFKNFDIAKHHGDDGTLDLDSALTSSEFKATGDASPEIAKSLLAIKNSQLQAKTSLAGLNGTLRDQFSSQVAGLAEDPDVKAGNQTGRGKVLDAVQQFGKVGGPDAQRVAGVYGQVLQNTPPEKMAQALANLQLQAKSAGEQMPQGATMDTGSQMQPGAVAPGTGAFKPAGAPLEKKFAPQVIESPTTGGKYRLTPGGQAVPITAAAGSGQAPFQNPGYQGQQSDVAANQTEVRGVRAAGDQAPLAANINQQILQLSKNAKTGPGTDTWQHVVGAVGAPFGLSPTASYQEVGKFLEKNAIANMQSMGGPPSDSRLDAAAKANGSTAFSPEALQKVTKFNDATTTALAQYRQGIDHSIGMGQNVDYTKLPAFKAAWAKNFDVDVFRVENALRDKDSAELAAIKHELGPERLKALAQKRQNLTALAQGQLPQ
jgi:hypothetical protein